MHIYVTLLCSLLDATFLKFKYCYQKIYCCFSIHCLFGMKRPSSFYCIVFAVVSLRHQIEKKKIIFALHYRLKRNFAFIYWIYKIFKNKQKLKFSRWRCILCEWMEFNWFLGQSRQSKGSFRTRNAVGRAKVFGIKSCKRPRSALICVRHINKYGVSCLRAPNAAMLTAYESLQSSRKCSDDC